MAFAKTIDPGGTLNCGTKGGTFLSEIYGEDKKQGNSKKKRGGGERERERARQTYRWIADSVY
jgi:hypothetical protein